MENLDVLFVDKDELIGFCYRLLIAEFFKDHDEYHDLTFGDRDDMVTAIDSSGTKCVFFFSEDAREKAAVPEEGVKWFCVSKDEKQTPERFIFFFSQRLFLSPDVLDRVRKKLDAYFVRGDFEALHAEINGERYSFFEKYWPENSNINEFPEKLYKYVSNESKHVCNAVFGDMSYVNPSTFNDPFDCDFAVSSYPADRNRYRVLCLSSTPTDILMWGYYGNEQKGICLEHDRDAILKATAEKYKGIVVFGKVSYKKSRPSPKKYFSCPFMTPGLKELLNDINCCFTKYKQWEHEQEYRFLAFDKGFEGSTNDYRTINSTPTAYYLGVSFDSAPFPCLSRTGITPVHKLVKDDKIYKLK